MQMLDAAPIANRRYPAILMIFASKMNNFFHMVDYF